MTTKSARIPVVAPHPDDAEFGAAGTIARWARGAAGIVYLVCTNGDKGTSPLRVGLLSFPRNRVLSFAGSPGVANV